MAKLILSGMVMAGIGFLVAGMVASGDILAVAAAAITRAAGALVENKSLEEYGKSLGYSNLKEYGKKIVKDAVIGAVVGAALTTVAIFGTKLIQNSVSDDVANVLANQTDEPIVMLSKTPDVTLENKVIINDSQSLTKYDKSVLLELTETDNFSESAINHIFNDEINCKGKAVGYHYDMIDDTMESIIQGTESLSNANQVFMAKVEVSGIAKTANNGYSTFSREQ